MTQLRRRIRRRKHGLGPAEVRSDLPFHDVESLAADLRVIRDGEHRSGGLTDVAASPQPVPGTDRDPGSAGADPPQQRLLSALGSDSP
jgi:hypothetical protein